MYRHFSDAPLAQDSAVQAEQPGAVDNRYMRKCAQTDTQKRERFGTPYLQHPTEINNPVVVCLGELPKDPEGLRW